MRLDLGPRVGPRVCRAPSACGRHPLRLPPLVPDGVFVDDEDRLAFALHPGAHQHRRPGDPRSDRASPADEACDDSLEEGIAVLAQGKAEAAATWRSPQNGKPTVRGVERLRAWCAPPEQLEDEELAK